LEERRRGVLSKRRSERLVGHEPANQDLDTSLRHVTTAFDGLKGQGPDRGTQSTGRADETVDGQRVRWQGRVANVRRGHTRRCTGIDNMAICDQ
jgi:hypothetical protein